MEDHWKLSLFQYLGRIVTEIDDDWPDVRSNTWKARRSWHCLDWILGREVVDTQTPGNFYVMVVQFILLFGHET